MEEPTRIKVLIAHGDPLISAGLAAVLGTRLDFELITLAPRSMPGSAVTLPSADVVVADYELGLRIIGAAVTRRVLILTHSDGEAKICRALELGARGYILLGCSLEDIIDGLRSVYLGGTALGPRITNRLADRMKQPPLTGRERDILRHMMVGLSNKEIASKSCIALGTVKTHVKAVLAKLGAARRTEAVIIAQRRGILGDEPVSGTNLQTRRPRVRHQGKSVRLRARPAKLLPPAWDAA
jgi:DNA-binding NarL/FixJ family response regulator